MAYELRLTQPIEELIPAMISFNNEELMRDITNALAKYDGVVYTEDTIAQAKADRATLNKAATALDDERKRVAKIYNQPYEHFKSQVDEVIKKIKNCNKNIDDQVKAFEQKKADEKREAIEGIFLDRLATFGSIRPDLKGFVTLDKLFKAEWLNVSKSIKKIGEEITAKLDSINEELTIIERLKSDSEDVIKAVYLRNFSLSQALAEDERLKEEKRAILEAKTRVEAKQEAVEEEKLCTVCFKAIGTINQIQALKKFIMENNIKIEKI